VRGRLRSYLTPGWLLFHLVTLALAVTMVLLGRWQLDVSDSKHFSLQNFGYAIQWWAFTAFALVMWARIVRDRGRAERPASQRAEPAEQPHSEVPYRRYVMPSSSDAGAHADPELAAYNDYLARLARRGEGTGE
jgi:DNA-binding transcriptional regulator of glucitol operon